MLRPFASHFDDMALAITIWMYTLPLLGFLVVPFFGLKVGLVAAAALFIAAMFVCWGVCSWKVLRE